MSTVQKFQRKDEITLLVDPRIWTIESDPFVSFHYKSVEGDVWKTYYVIKSDKSYAWKEESNLTLVPPIVWTDRHVKYMRDRAEYMRMYDGFVVSSLISFIDEIEEKLNE